jgi:hypothetical protein
MHNLRSRSWFVFLLSFALLAPRASRAESSLKSKTTSNSTQNLSKAQITFAAYGDIPYEIRLPNGRTDDQVLYEDIAPALRERIDIPFIINLGDLGRPERSCNDDWLHKTQLFWERKLVKPVFYTPGDNDWADCDRPSLARRQGEIERLQNLRNIFFSRPKNVSSTWKLEEVQRILTRDPQLDRPEITLETIRRIVTMNSNQFAQEWNYKAQPELPENAIWIRDGVLFVTVHMISTDNGRSDIFLDDPKQAIARVDERDRQNERWLNLAFDQAQRHKAKAVVVATQLDPFGPAKHQETSLAHCLNNPAYAAFCRQIETLAGGLGKPVLLLHGDTNAYCLDQPFTQTKNLWRLNAPGDFKYIDAAIIKVFPDDRSQPFRATGLLSGEPAPAVCDYSP